MAEAKAAESTRPEESSPKLVALPEEKKGGSSTRSAEPVNGGISRLAFGAALVLLALALVGLIAQTRRAGAQAEQIALLGSQVEGLQEQLSVAHNRLATYDMQFNMVQATVADLFQQITNLHELVNTDPFEGRPEPEER